MSGFESPNYTQTPNDLFDQHMPYMGYAELKVVLFLCRKTFGFHREKVRVSIRKLARGTGLTARNAFEGAERAAERGLITKSQDGGITIWSVVVGGTVSVSVGDTGKPKSVSVEDTPSIKETSSKEKKEKKEKKVGADAPKRKGRTLSDACLKYHELAGVWPNKIQEKAIDGAILSSDLEKWAGVLTAWRMKNFAPTNVTGMLQWFTDGVPEYKQIGNGSAQPDEPLGFDAIRRSWEKRNGTGTDGLRMRRGFGNGMAESEDEGTNR